MATRIFLEKENGSEKGLRRGARLLSDRAFSLLSGGVFGKDMSCVGAPKPRVCPIHAESCKLHHMTQMIPNIRINIDTHLRRVFHKLHTRQICYAKVGIPIIDSNDLCPHFMSCACSENRTNKSLQFVAEMCTRPAHPAPRMEPNTR